MSYLKNTTNQPAEQVKADLAFGILSEGTRNDGLMRLAGAMRRRGRSQAEIEAALLAANQKRCRPPLGHREVAKIAASSLRWLPGGPDILEVSWNVVQQKQSPSNYARFVELAQELQRARPEQPVALPLARIADLMMCHWTLVSRLRRRAQDAGLLEPADRYVAHRRAAQYRVDLDACLTKEQNPSETYLTSLTSGLVRHPPKRPLVRQSPSETPAQIIRLAARGFHLFPCRPRAKEPYLKNWPEVASTDTMQLAEWALRFPACNWAVCTGAASRVWVLDVDGEAGLASWFALLREHDALMEIETLGVATGRGSHLYFRWPENGAQIRNGRGTLGAGLDVRGERGYAICPPSTHASGKGYEWLGGNESRAVSEAPLWLLELVSQRKGVEGGDLVCGRCHPNPAEVRVQ